MSIKQIQYSPLVQVVKVVIQLVLVVRVVKQVVKQWLPMVTIEVVMWYFSVKEMKCHFSFMW